jgi:hypothetical protein
VGNLDLVAGIYRRRMTAPVLPSNLRWSGEADKNGFAEALEAPTGFMYIAREVFDCLADAGIGPDELFDTLRDGERYLGKDYASACASATPAGACTSISNAT